MSVISGLSSGSGSGKAYAYIRATVYDSSFYDKYVLATNGYATFTATFTDDGVAYIPVSGVGTYTVSCYNKDKTSKLVGTATISKRNEIVDITITKDGNTLIVINIKKSPVDDTHPSGNWIIKKNGSDYKSGMLLTSMPTSVYIPNTNIAETDYFSVQIVTSKKTKTFSVGTIKSNSTSAVNGYLYSINALSSMSMDDFADVASDLHNNVLSNDDLPWAVGDSISVPIGDTKYKFVVLATKNDITVTSKDNKKASYILGMKNAYSKQNIASDYYWLNGYSHRTYKSGNILNVYNEIKDNVNSKFKNSLLICNYGTAMLSFYDSGNAYNDKYDVFGFANSLNVDSAYTKSNNQTNTPPGHQAFITTQFPYYNVVTNRRKCKGDYDLTPVPWICEASTSYIDGSKGFGIRHVETNGKLNEGYSYYEMPDENSVTGSGYKQARMYMSLICCV